jgi:hypothetical protein
MLKIKTSSTKKKNQNSRNKKKKEYFHTQNKTTIQPYEHSYHLERIHSHACLCLHIGLPSLVHTQFQLSQQPKN